MSSRTPYAEITSDLYTETKVAIEPVVLGANDDRGLLTCAIRPAGIYGPGQCHMLEQLISKVTTGMVLANLGDPNVTHDHTYVHNLVHAEILAAEHLVAGNPSCGRAYFITDGVPQNTFEFVRPLIEAMGHKYPNAWVPSWLLMPTLRAWEWLHFRTGAPAPLITPKELEKCTVTHFSTNDDAERDFGYVPPVSVQQAIEACIPYCQQRADEIREARRAKRPAWLGFTGAARAGAA